jgi:protein N-terminal glutamine amidohydrolase
MPDYPYTPFYCEENIWQLCQNPRFAELETKVVFISNRNNSCILWGQKAGKGVEGLVLWDYHVLLLCKEETWKVWDLDTNFDLPAGFSFYVRSTFKLEEVKLADEFAPIFKVIDTQEFVRTFSSDRSHMRKPDGTWNATPPEWPIIGDGKEPNLMQLIDMENKSIGEVMELAEFTNKFAT